MVYEQQYNFVELPSIIEAQDSSIQIHISFASFDNHPFFHLQDLHLRKNQNHLLIIT